MLNKRSPTVHTMPHVGSFYDNKFYFTKNSQAISVMALHTFSKNKSIAL